MNITSYGEDFLTLWALTRKLNEVLNQLEDKTPQEKCKIIYRPSFGRAGGSMTDQRAEFGEFDSIIVASNDAYLIESKWDGNGRNKQRVNLEKQQVKRHVIFKWYVENWSRDVDWDKFIKDKSQEFKNTFPENKLAPSNTILKKSLEEIVPQVRGKKLHNVLMYLYSVPILKPPRLVYPEAIFRLVTIEYPNEKNFLELNI